MSSILEKPVCRPEKSAVGKSARPFTVNAKCVEVDDLGVVETDFGKKPMVRFVFEVISEDGSAGRRLWRPFHKNFYEKSALCVEVKSWCGRDLSQENKKIGEPDLNEFTGETATLKIETRVGRQGTSYENITAILPGEEIDVAACEDAEVNG